MANNNPLTSGEYATSGEGENSSNRTPSAYKAQQQAVQMQDRAAVKAKVAQSAAERAARRALNGANNPYNPGVAKVVQTTSNAHGPAPLPVPKARRGRGK